MKNLSPILYLLFIVSFGSCVNRIDIPEEEDARLHISLEMLTGENTIVADFKTSNNLNGSFPISTPNKAIITITEDKVANLDADNEIELVWNGDLQKYISTNTTTFLRRGKRYILNAALEDSGLKAISAETKVPFHIDIEESVLLSERIVSDIDGNEFWESTVGITFIEGAGYEDRYGHLVIKGQETERIISAEGDTTYIIGPELKTFTLSGINVGTSAITDVIHREGFLIDLSKLENNYIEVVLQSNHPITKPNHVTDFLEAKIYAVTKDHHDYHISLHNINKGKGNIFDEPALFNSNIENGLGIFSSCSAMNKKLKLR